MNEKIKKLSSKMIGIFPSKDLSAQDIYVHLRDIMKNQKDYFVLLKEEDIVKLTIYLYSLHKTGKYELGDKILNNIFFAVLVNPSDTYYTDTCPECDGNGNIRCDECDGSGNERCSECDGKGKVDCPDCDGSGEDGEGNPCPECQGGGEVECDECDGDGEVTCGYCGGDGEQRCPECDGTGEVETGDKYYTIYNICSWNKTLNNLCELNLKTFVPVYTEDNIDEYRDTMIILRQSDEHTNGPTFTEDTNIEDFYCVGYYDEPELFLSGSFEVYVEDEPDINYLLGL